MTKKILALVGILILVGVLAAGCGGTGTNSPSATQKAITASNNLQGQVYQSKNNVEFRNYNWRQEIADDPATILWCTFFPPGISGVSDGTTPGGAFTVPIAGKLTSSNKRPYQSSRYSYDDNGSVGVSGELPGPDHMYGSSSEYRYGFGPNGKADYQDFTDFASYCTTTPKVWQANTPIITATSVTLSSISKAATAAIKSGDAAKATAILGQAGNVTRKK